MRSHRHAPVVRSPLLGALAVAAGALAIAGCGSSSKSSSTTATTTSTPAATTNTTPAPAAAGAQKLSLAANPEGQLKYTTSSLTAKAGSVTIDFTNSAPLAHNLTIQKRYDEAESIERRALAIRERPPGVDDLELARSYSNLTFLMYFTGRHAEAEGFARRSLALTENATGRDHLRVAGALSTLGLVLIAAGREGRVIGAEDPKTK